MSRKSIGASLFLFKALKLTGKGLKSRARQGFSRGAALVLLVLLGRTTLAPAQTIITVAGNGISGFSGDGGPAISAQLRSPFGVAIDGAGNLYIADLGNHCIRKVDPSGIITTVAGTPEVNGFSGDGGPATAAEMNSPHGVAMDGAGNLYIADQGNHRVRKVDPFGTITTFAGTGILGSTGDGGPANAARLEQPSGLAVDGAGNLYIADINADRVRKVDAFGIITTVAGTGVEGFSGDGGPATAAKLAAPVDVAVDGAGNLYITDRGNDRIRKVAVGGIITTVVGTGVNGFFGDGGSATSAQLSNPLGVAVDGTGNLFVVDQNNNRIRKIDAFGIINTVAGTGVGGICGDGGPATAAQLNQPTGIAVDGAGNLHIGDQSNHRIREVGNFVLTSIQINAAALSVPNLTLVGVGDFSPQIVQTFDLAPGSYTLQYDPGPSAPAFAKVDFTVTGTGTVDFDPGLDNILCGRGTHTLLVKGARITIDPRALSYPILSLNPIGQFSTNDEFVVTLLPGPHLLLGDTGPNVASAQALFEITNAGTIDFDSGLDNILSGRNISTLVVNGAPIQIDATAISFASLALPTAGLFSTNTTFDVTLLPGPHQLLADTGPNVTSALVTFTVTNAGTLDFDISLDGIMSGRGATTLTVSGAAIQIDATALSEPTFQVAGISTVFPTAAVQAFRFLPGPHEFVSSANLRFIFSVENDATVDYDPSLDSFLSGRGTNTLTIFTPEQRIENLVDEVKSLVDQGVLNNGQGNALIVKLENALKKLDQNNTAAAINQLEAFINQVNALINSGILTPAQGQPLIDAANAVIDQLNGPAKQGIAGQSDEPVQPTTFALAQNYPNPFNPETMISFALPEAGEVELSIYNLQGQLVWRLVSQQMNVGHHAVIWNGKDEAGQVLPSGVYLYKLKVNGFEETRKMTFMK